MSIEAAFFGSPQLRNNGTPFRSLLSQVTELLGLKFDAKELSDLPGELLDGWKELLEMSSEAA